MEINLGGRQLDKQAAESFCLDFQKASEIVSIILNNNMLYSVPSNLDKFSCLTTLELSQCRLSDISGLSCMTSLEMLNLSWNSLSSIDAVKDLIRLQRLNLIGNNLTAAASFAKLTRLEVLHLSQNRLNRIGVLNAPALHTISLSRNYRLPKKLQICATICPERSQVLTGVICKLATVDLEAVSFLFCWKMARTSNNGDDCVLRRLPRDMSRLIAETILRRKHEICQNEL